jgi:single-strand DNA-binding protein
MAGSVNKAIILGRVGKEPEIRSTQNGLRIASFSVATSETWRDKHSGEKKEKTEWHRISVFPENTVKVVEDYVRKGDLILVEGRIETRKWTDQSGADRYSTEIVVTGFHGSITLIGRTEGRNSGGGRSDRDVEQAAGGGSGAQRASNDLDDEIPF